MRSVKVWIWSGMGIALAIGMTVQAENGVYRLGRLTGTETERVRTESGDVVVYLSDWNAVFSVEDPRTALIRVRITDGSDQVVYDSAAQAGNEVLWDFASLDPAASGDGTLRYTLWAWDAWNESIGGQTGEIRLFDEASGGPTIVALAFDDPDNFTIGGNLGVGIEAPARAVHLKGSNAVFRMDRSTNSAAFMLVRTDLAGTSPWKTYVVGVDASGPNQGQFVINDLGTAVGGGGTNRMTIDNAGNTTFTGTVSATEFLTPSSLRFKTDVAALENPLEMVSRLRGVEFKWKTTGKPAIGLIAEEVAQVVPQAVSWQADGQAEGVNYSSLVALLVEATKANQKEILTLGTEIDQLEAEVKAELEKARGNHP